MPVTSADELNELLDVERIAVIGCSSTPTKAAYKVPAYLQRQGYDVIPVNPYADEILGVDAVDSLDDVERDVDIVDVFRPSEEVPDVVEQVVERRETESDVETLWLQSGIRHDEAAERAESAGLDVVQDRCLKVVHRQHQ